VIHCVLFLKTTLKQTRAHVTISLSLKHRKSEHYNEFVTAMRLLQQLLFIHNTTCQFLNYRIKMAWWTINERVSLHRKVLYCTLKEVFHDTATECHLPYGITQSYLLPDTSEHTLP